MSCDIDLDRVGHDVYGHGVDADEVDDVDDKYSHDRDEPCPVAPLGCTCRSAQSPEQHFDGNDNDDDNRDIYDNFNMDV